MEQVLQCYGKGIAAGIVLIAVMVLLFAGIRDEQGNRGIINIIKTWYAAQGSISAGRLIFCGRRNGRRTECFVV